MKKENIIVFNLDDLRLGLLLENVIKIIRVVEITQLPNASENILGIINFQGEIIPIANIRKRYNLPEKKITLNDKIIIVSVNSKIFGFLADSVEDLMIIDEDEILDGEQIIEGLEFIKGLLKIHNGIILIVELLDILSQDEIKTIKSQFEVN